jgi:formyl-CoA transferase
MERSQPGNALVNWYRTADGRWIYFCVMYAGPLWAELCARIDRHDLIDDPRFASDPARTANAGECAKILDDVFAQRTYAEWLDRLGPFGGAWGPMRTPREMHAHPQVIANQFVVRHASLEGFEFGLVAPPMQFDRQPTIPQGPAPEHAQHTEEVLLELGLEWDEIAQLNDDGVIGPG